VRDPAGKQQHDRDQEHAEDDARGLVGELEVEKRRVLRPDRQEHVEQCAEHGTGERAEPPDHGARQQQDRDADRECVRVHIRQLDREERTGRAGEGRRDAEGEGLV
jgi:hypothetical protein